MPSMSPRILVVEDDPDFRANLVEWLAGSGYLVREAANGREAIALATAEAFDVVVTDLRMPEADGLELLEWFKEMYPDTAVIFLSGQATVQDAVMALREWGGFDFLEKPVELTVLDAVIERSLARSKVSRTAPPDPPSAPMSPLARQALAIIGERFRDPIGLSELSQQLGYSAAYLTDALRRETGKTVLQWIIHHRLEDAKRLLNETDWTAQRVSQTVGYADYNHFLRQFRKLHGMPPSAWREARKNA